MSGPALTPAGSPERSEPLDALRGASLWGVVLVNALTHFRDSAFEQYLPVQGRSPLDAFLSSAVAIAIETKAYILLSLLFGVGLAAQHERARAAKRSFAPYAARRLAMLFVVGVFHMLVIWDGDILALYAVTGLVVAPLLALSTRTLLVIAGAFLVLQVLPLPYPTAFLSPEEMAAHVEQARHVYAHGSYATIFAFRLREVLALATISLWSLPRTIALHLIGVCAWRARATAARLSGGLVTALSIGLVGTGGAAVASIPRAHSELGVAILSAWGATVLALGAGAAFLALAERTVARRVLVTLAPLGRMALTSYLTQSIALGFIFYGYGLGLFGRLSVASVSAVALAIFVAQAIASALWLRRFRFGPVEWAWRSVTYASLQPMRRAGRAG